MKKNSESGNVLWLILVTIALLAVLTVTISSMSDSTEQTGDIERYRIHATSIMRHSSAVKESVERMRMAGIGESELNFSSAGSGACSDCLIFNSIGGGMHYEPPNLTWLDTDHDGDPGYREWEFSGGNVITDVGTTRPELIMYLSYVQPGLCAQINSMLKISGAIPEDNDGFDVSGYAGTFSASETIDNMDGHESGCFLDDSAGGRDYTYYHVLVKR